MSAGRMYQLIHVNMQTLRSGIYVTRSPKGHVGESSMIDWIEQVLRPYVSYVTGQLADMNLQSISLWTTVGSIILAYIGV